MKISAIINKTLKIGGLALLLNINSNEIANAQFDWLFNPKKGVIEKYLEAAINSNAEKMKNYCTRKRANNFRLSDYGLKVYGQMYKGYRIHSYIPQEGKDQENIYWIERKDGLYNHVILVKENGEWKIEDIGSPIK